MAERRDVAKNNRVHNPLTAIRPDQVCREQEVRRALSAAYHLLLTLAEEEAADSGDTAAKQDPEPAVTDVAFQERDG